MNGYESPTSKKQERNRCDCRTWANPQNDSDENHNAAIDLSIQTEPDEPAVLYESKLENLREALEKGTVDDIKYFIAN